METALKTILRPTNGDEPIEIKLELTNGDKSLNYLKYFDYYEGKIGNGTYCERRVKDKYKNIPEEILDELAQRPCLEHKFENDNCIKCGAIEEVFNNHKKRGYYYAGNSHTIKLV